jgi:cytidylate kinase
MDYRVLTVNREFGSGGGRIAETIAKWLDWKLLDAAIINAIAYEAHVDPKVVQRHDEHVDSWLGRLNHQTMRSAALAAGLELAEGAVFNCDAMVQLTKKIVEQAYSEGNCVIVGRGAQCILAHRADVFHAFVYAPHKQRILRLRERLPKGTEAEASLRTVDEERAKYLMQYYGKCWNSPHLYDLMISTRWDEDNTARVILNVMKELGAKTPALQPSAS